MKRIIVFYILIICLMFQNNLFASVVEATPYDFFFSKAKKIVQGRISKIKPVFYANDKICGWELSVNVTKSWRGGNNSFVYFTKEPYFSKKKEVEHLFIVLENPYYGNQDSKYNSVYCGSIKRKEFYISGYKFQTEWTEQLIFPLDEAAEAEYGDKWLVYSSKAGVSHWIPKEEKHINLISEKFPYGYSVIKLKEFIDTFLKENSKKAE